MRLIGLAGPAGAGKDSAADHLVVQFGFIKYAFADPLYEEVADAYGVTVDSLQDRRTKEVPQARMSLSNCDNLDFVDIAFTDLVLTTKYLDCLTSDFLARPLSPRYVLQLWGTDYRRAQNENYWIDRARSFLKVFSDFGETNNCPGVLISGTRFRNEVDLIDELGGELWHVKRTGAQVADNAGHVSAQQLPEREHDKILYNNSTIAQLKTAASLLFAHGIELEG